MAKHGSVGEYNSDGEDWVSYIERIQNYFVVNKVTTEAAKKRAILLSVCGAQTSTDQKFMRPS